MIFLKILLIASEADDRGIIRIDERDDVEQSLLDIGHSSYSSLLKLDAATQTQKKYGCFSVGVQCNIAGLEELTLLPPEEMPNPNDSTEQAAENIETDNPSDLDEHRNVSVTVEDDLSEENDDESVYEDDDDSSWSSLESDDDYSGSSTLGINKNL